MNEQETFSSGMKRKTQAHKPRFELIIPLSQRYDETLLYRWAKLMQKGTKEYSDRNWEQANSPEEIERFKAAAFRHFMQWLQGEEDQDHAAAILFNINGAEYVKGQLK